MYGALHCMCSHFCLNMYGSLYMWGGNLLVRTTVAARLNLSKFDEICKKTEGTLKKIYKKKNIAEVRALKQNPADRGPHGGAHGAHGAPWVPHGPHGAPWVPHGAPGGF